MEARMKRYKSPVCNDDPLLIRICKVLDEPPRILAQNIGIPYLELEPLETNVHRLTEMEYDTTWSLIENYLSSRIGDMIAAKTDLNKHMQRQKKKKLINLARQRDYFRKRKNNE
jgi:hypothetical protein